MGLLQNSAQTSRPSDLPRPYLQRCPTRDSGPPLGREEAASWLPNMRSSSNSSRPAHARRLSAADMRTLIIAICKTGCGAFAKRRIT